MIVVDASIAAAWVLPEVQTQAAISLIQSGRELVAVDLIKVEVFSAILKAVRMKRLTPVHATSAIENFKRASLTLKSTGEVVPAAYAIAQRTVARSTTPATSRWLGRSPLHWRRTTKPWPRWPKR